MMMIVVIILMMMNECCGVFMCIPDGYDALTLVGQNHLCGQKNLCQYITTLLPIIIDLSYQLFRGFFIGRRSFVAKKNHFNLVNLAN